MARKRPLITLRAWAKKALPHPECIEIASTHTPSASFNLAIQLDHGEEVARAVRWLAMLAVITARKNLVVM